MFRLTITVCLFYFALGANDGPALADWWNYGIVYQIYPRSFKDSNGDGIGDLNGITSKMDHFNQIGITGIWLSPIFKSPQVDFGYDISNFTDIEPTYGTLADFDNLVAKAKIYGIKVMLDFVPNHSSYEHPWFKKSIQKVKPYDEYYVWRDAKVVNGTRKPPNNWLSVFGGSAWEWNDVRKQYYLHQFAIGQPDLNYRSALLKQEMTDALTFWLNRGVSGFRIDAINHMFEDANFRDEPSANRTDIPADDENSLIHIYTRDLQDTYEVLKTWRNMMDDYSNKTKTHRKMLLTEAYTDHNLTIKYYQYGSIPFNFMFIASLNNKSSAVDFQSQIQSWLNDMPKNDQANWVVGNHDNHRVATRFGTLRADQITMLSIILPGVAVVYNGDEIGMEDRYFTYTETVDTAGCNAGPDRYQLKSRDPERTPYQWDNTTSAGFSNNWRTWLPVNSNYKTLNLAAQLNTPNSHYKVFQSLAFLKQDRTLFLGNTKVGVLKEKVLAVVRQYQSNIVVLVINFSDQPITVDATIGLNLPSVSMKAFVASVGSGVQPGSWHNSRTLNIPGAASIVLVSVPKYNLDFA